MKKLIASLPLRARRLLARDAEWDESKHPRGKDGKFGSGGGSAYRAKLEDQKKEILGQDQSDQALFVWKSGFADKDTAVEAMNNGTASDLVEQYFDLLERNGDPEPTKEPRKNADQELRREVEAGQHGGDYTQARVDYIRDWTGMSEEQAVRMQKQFDTWFGGSWSRADTETLDEYIDKDGVYDGPIYRGMHFDEKAYGRFMKDLRPGSTMRMNGYNSSWTSDKETAWGFARNGDRSVIIKCVKNKTSAPVSHLSTKGEDEILAHSRAQWTVLRVSEGSGRTEIIVMEQEHRMDRVDRDRRKEQRDAAPSSGGAYESLEQRMNEQSQFMEVDPPPADLFRKRK